MSQTSRTEEVAGEMKDPAPFCASAVHTRSLCVFVLPDDTVTLFVIKDKVHVLFVWTDMLLQIIVCESGRR